MREEPNYEAAYQAAYETLTRAIEQCGDIIFKAQTIASVELNLELDRPVDEVILEAYRSIKEEAGRT